MTSHSSFDIHPLNLLLFIMIAVVMIISFTFLILTESDDEKHYCDDVDPDEVEHIYETADELREQPDCFGEEAAKSLATFNNEQTEDETEDEANEENDDEHDSEHIKEYLPDILLLVKMPYSHGYNMLKRYDSEHVQFYGFHQERTVRSRSQSI
jgi:hypothetical protein